jgi:hypothetical protein
VNRRTVIGTRSPSQTDNPVANSSRIDLRRPQVAPLPAEPCPDEHEPSHLAAVDHACIQVANAVVLVRAGSTRHRKSLVRDGREWSRPATENRGSQVIHSTTWTAEQHWRGFEPSASALRQGQSCGQPSLHLRTAMSGYVRCRPSGIPATHAEEVMATRNSGASSARAPADCSASRQLSKASSSWRRSSTSSGGQPARSEDRSGCGPRWWPSSAPPGSSQSPTSSSGGDNLDRSPNDVGDSSRWAGRATL